MMDIINAIILGVVQGLTEFLPVSSSGHLVIFRNFLNVEDIDLTFDILLHMGTLVPIFIIFWKDISGIIIELFNLAKDFSKKLTDKTHVIKFNESRNFIIMIIVASIPTAFMGIFLKGLVDSLFTLKVIGFTYIYTGLILMIADKIKIGSKQPKDITPLNALVVGIFQGIAIIPGVSRSGSTITGGLFTGLTRKTAVRFSFLMSIPAILGAALFDIKEMIEGAEVGAYINYSMVAGFIAAALSGYFAIKILIKLLSQSKLHVFSYYCWALALVIIIYNYFI